MNLYKCMFLCACAWTVVCVIRAVQWRHCTYDLSKLQSLAECKHGALHQLGDGEWYCIDFDDNYTVVPQIRDHELKMDECSDAEMRVFNSVIIALVPHCLFIGMFLERQTRIDVHNNYEELS